MFSTQSTLTRIGHALLVTVARVITVHLVTIWSAANIFGLVRSVGIHLWRSLTHGFLVNAVPRTLTTQKGAQLQVGKRNGHARKLERPRDSTNPLAGFQDPTLALPLHGKRRHWASIRRQHARPLPEFSLAVVAAAPPRRHACASQARAPRAPKGVGWLPLPQGLPFRVALLLHLIL